MGVVEDHLGGIEIFLKFRHSPPKYILVAPKKGYDRTQMWCDCAQMCFDCSQMLVFVPSPAQKKKGDLANGRMSQKLGVLPHF
jgi:hypothetical protein